MKLRFVIVLAVVAIILNGYSFNWWHKHLKEEREVSNVQSNIAQRSISISDVTYDEDSELPESKNYKNAVDYFRKNDYIIAINELNADLERNPNHAQSYFLLGKIYEDATFPDGKYFSKMVNNYEKYIELRPHGLRVEYAKLKSAQYFISIGLMQQNTEALEKAENYLITLNQDDNDVRMGLGAIYLDKKNFKQAIAEFEKSANLQPNELRLKYNSLGLAYIQTGRYGNAENVLKIAIQIEPKNKFAHNNLGFVFMRLRKFKEAESQFEEALKIDPKYKNAKDNLDWLHSPYAK